LLNGSMWTIAYEFRCYLLVLFAGVIGLLSHRFVVALFTVFCLALAAAHPPILDNYVPFAARTVGLPFFDVEFAGVFGCGALFYLYEDRINYDWRVALLAAVTMVGLMFSSRLAVAAVAILGAYVLFCVQGEAAGAGQHWGPRRHFIRSLSLCLADSDGSHLVHAGDHPLARIP